MAKKWTPSKDKAAMRIVNWAMSSVNVHPDERKALYKKIVRYGRNKIAENRRIAPCT